MTYSYISHVLLSLSFSVYMEQCMQYASLNFILQGLICALLKVNDCMLLRVLRLQLWQYLAKVNMFHELIVLNNIHVKLYVHVYSCVNWSVPRMFLHDTCYEETWSTWGTNVVFSWYHVCKRMNCTIPWLIAS